MLLILKTDALGRNHILLPAWPLSRQFKQAANENDGAFRQFTGQQAKKKQKKPLTPWPLGLILIVEVIGQNCRSHEPRGPFA